MHASDRTPAGPKPPSRWGWFERVDKGVYLATVDLNAGGQSHDRSFESAETASNACEGQSEREASIGSCPLGNKGSREKDLPAGQPRKRADNTRTEGKSGYETRREEAASRKGGLTWKGRDGSALLGRRIGSRWRRGCRRWRWRAPWPERSVWIDLYGKREGDGRNESVATPVLARNEPLADDRAILSPHADSSRERPFATGHEDLGGLGRGGQEWIASQPTPRSLLDDADVRTIGRTVVANPRHSHRGLSGRQ